MKKIININLSGRVIPIDESAYESLQQYIESLRRYFSNEEGRDEIINDIESRIAELMNDKVRKGAEAISKEDVEEIIGTMGRVEDFEAADKEAAEPQATGQFQQTNADEQPKIKKGRLYRDSSDKFLGGVCSGIAHYLNVDPSIIRILFAVLTFGGFGFGLLLYLILWIALPPKEHEGFAGKRLYRNPDDKMLGGVAGGLAAYFDWSARNVRLIFAAPVILRIVFSIINRISWHYDYDLAFNVGFGSITGTFILIYVILWMVLPEAVTDYQKMEMRGETVDVNRIRQNVREGMGNVKDRMKTWGEEVKGSAQNISSKAKEFAGRGKVFASEVKDTAAKTGSGFGHAIGVLFKAFFLFIAGTIAFALFVSLIALLFGGVAWWPINNFLWTSKWQQGLAWATLILFFIVPLAGFIVWIIRRITKSKSKNNYLGWTFGGLWTLGWIAGFLFVSTVIKDFREYEHVDTSVAINQPANNKVIVTVTEPPLEYSGNFGWIDNDEKGWDLTTDTLKVGAVKINVKASADDQYHVTVKKYSFGKTNAEALGRADKVQFSVQSRDSLLDLDNCYAISSENKFRFQNVEVEFFVPVGKKIRFDKSVTEKLNFLDVKVRRTFRNHRINGVQFNSDEDNFEFRTDVDYVMGADGELKSPDSADTKTGTDNYRYDKNETDSLDLEKSIEKKKQELKQLEEKRVKKTNAFNKIIQDKKAPQYVSGPAVPALTEWF